MVNGSVPSPHAVSTQCRFGQHSDGPAKPNVWCINASRRYRISFMKERIGIRRPTSFGLAFGLAVSFTVNLPLRAQTEETFEVASVKLSPPQAPPPGASAPFPRMAGGPGTKDPEHLRYTN